MLHPIFYILPIGAFIYQVYLNYAEERVCIKDGSDTLCFIGESAVEARTKNIRNIRELLNNCDPDNLSPQDQDKLEFLAEAIENGFEDFNLFTTEEAAARQHTSLASAFYCLRYYLDADEQFQQAEKNKAQFSPAELAQKNKAHEITKLLWSSVKAEKTAKSSKQSQSAHPQKIKLHKPPKQKYV